MAPSSAHWLSAALPTDIYSVESVKALEAQLFELPEISPTLLMKRAGRCALDMLNHIWPEVQKITVYCGAGNNGGDGYVLAALAKARCLPVSIIQLAEPESEPARRAFEYAKAESVEIHPFHGHVQPTEGVIVDALFGIGLNRPVSGRAEEAIDEINQSGLSVFAMDVPSGICADTGRVLGSAVKASATASFVALKAGLVTPMGRFHSGTLAVATPSVLLRELASALRSDPSPVATRIQDDGLPNLPHRPIHAHKGHFGHVMVVGGNTGMGGAALLAAQSAARVGAGLTSLAAPPETAAASLVRMPEIMANTVVSGQELEPLLEKPSHLVIGPGLGDSAWSLQMLQRVLMANKPTVFDADALNLLASQDRLTLASHSASKVLTPHPGEAARLLGVSTSDIENNRWQAATQLRDQFNATVVLKGAGTIVATANPTSVSSNTRETHLWLCSAGNPGMASGGMGDVLAGMIVGFMAQGMTPDQAALWGVFLHAKAGDELAEEYGQRGLQASDLIPQVRNVLCRIESTG